MSNLLARTLLASICGASAASANGYQDLHQSAPGMATA
jgi:hypothetical protein